MTKQDSREPWRILRTADEDSAAFEIWTRYDVTPGSRNNYMVAGGIQNLDDAKRLCDGANEIAALREALSDLVQAHDCDMGRGALKLRIERARAALKGGGK